jgi:hypothetical protein
MLAFEYNSVKTCAASISAVTAAEMGTIDDLTLDGFDSLNFRPGQNYVHLTVAVKFEQLAELYRKPVTALRSNQLDDSCTKLVLRRSASTTTTLTRTSRSIPRAKGRELLKEEQIRARAR